MALPALSDVLRAERQEQAEQSLKDRDKNEWREYIANKREPLVKTERSKVTGY